MSIRWMVKLLLPGILVAMSGLARAENLKYPETRKTGQVDDYFGIKVDDPYRWLEDDNAEDVLRWVKEQNTLTFGYLNNLPGREAIRRRLDEIVNYPRYSAPFRVGKFYFFTKNEGLQNQSVYYYQRGLDGPPAVFLDPNTFSADGTVAVQLLGGSQDDRYIAFSVQEAGSDWQELRVMEIATRRTLPDRVRWVKFSGTAWHRNGFFYTGFDEPEKGTELSAVSGSQKLKYHRLGDPQEKDQLWFEDPAHPLRYYQADVTEDGRYLVLSSSEGTHGSEISWLDLKAGGRTFQLLCPGFDFNHTVLQNTAGGFIVQTNQGAPNYRLVLVDPRRPDVKHWRTLVAEQPEAMEGAVCAAGRIFVSYLKDVTSRIYQYSLNGRREREIVLPGLGSAWISGGKKKDRQLFYTYQSFTHPPAIYRYEAQSGRSGIFRQPAIKFNAGEYETKQVFYPSKDGTRIPMFLVHRKGLALDGQNPLLLYGYGGFNSSETPYFSAANLVLLENGGIFAVANLRGGAEYGEKWHEAGMKLKKQNVFDDFIAAAEYLIANRYTGSDRLAILGGSNGGLLVGACMNQRPELFKVAFPAVGVMDMLRFHKFTVGWGWVVEYGSSENREDFQNLLAYSPYHNLKSGVCYPATMITTADHDDRVVPAHSFKFAARLQECQACERPVLIRIETRAGHGGGRPMSKILDELADQWAFMFYHTGVSVKY